MHRAKRCGSCSSPHGAPDDCNAWPWERNQQTPVHHTERALLHGFAECATAQKIHGKSATESALDLKREDIWNLELLRDVQRAQRCAICRYTSKAETQHTKTSLALECRSSDDFGNILDALNRLNILPP